MLSEPLLALPASDPAFARETLAYLEAHDAPTSEDYAFVAYKETHLATGTWCVRINARPLPGALFHPNAIRIQARAASAQGRAWFTWGKSLSPAAGDPRKVEFRVHVRDGQAVAIELYVRLRAYDGSPDDPRSLVFPWPGN